MPFPRWHAKPPPGWPIDWSNPMSVGLRDAWLLNEAAGVTAWNQVKPLSTATVPASAVAWGVGKTAGPATSHTASTTGIATARAWDLNGSGTAPPFTIAARIFPTSSSSYQCIYADKGGNNGLFTNAGKLAWYPRITTGPTTILNRWADVAVTYDGTTLTTWLDGQVEGTYSGTVIGFSYYGYTGATGPYIGGDTTDPYNGRIEHVHVWQRALSQAELLALAENPYRIYGRSLWMPDLAYSVGGGTTDVSGTDSASLAESATLAAATAGTDAATAGESATLAASAAATDAGTLADATAAIAATLATTDAVTLGESVALVAALATTDAGSFAESVDVTAFTGAVGTDSGTLGESATLAASAAATDGGTLGEAASVAVAIAAVDSGHLSEATSGTGTTTTDLRAGLNAYLRAQSDLTAIVGTAIRPGFRPQLDALPSLTYTVIDNPRLHGVSGVNAQALARVQFDCWSRDLSGCVSIKRALEQSLDGYRGDLGGVTCQWARQISEHDLHEEPKDASDRWIYRITVDYHIKHVCPAP